MYVLMIGIPKTALVNIIIIRRPGYNRDTVILTTQRVSGKRPFVVFVQVRSAKNP